jgi:hypothetical protein
MSDTEDFKKFRLDKVRLSFSSIFRTTTDQNGDECYKANFINDPSTKEGRLNEKKIQRAFKTALTEKFGEKAESIKISDPKRLFFRDGETAVSSTTDEVYDGYEGMMFVTAKNKSNTPGKKPSHFPVVDGRRKPVDEDSGLIYDGCYVNAFISVYAVTGKEKGGHGVFATIEGIQFESNGEPFGSAGMSAEQMFEERESFDEDEEELI